MNIKRIKYVYAKFKQQSVRTAAQRTLLANFFTNV